MRLLGLEGRIIGRFDSGEAISATRSRKGLSELPRRCFIWAWRKQRRNAGERGDTGVAATPRRSNHGPDGQIKTADLKCCPPAGSLAEQDQG